jgi:hypothetical protein
MAFIVYSSLSDAGGHPARSRASRLTTPAVVATASAPAAPVAHNLGFLEAGRFSAESGTAPPRWTRIVSASPLNTTLTVPRSYRERSILKTYGSFASSGAR